MDHSQLDLESLEMDTIGIYRDTVSSIAEFMEGPGSGVPVASNLSGSLMKAMSLTSPKGVLKQGAFIISKEGILLGRTVGGKVDKIMDDVWKMIHIIKEERGEEEDW